MSLTARLSLDGPPPSEPEDFLATSSLGVLFPGDVTDQHGDADHGILYTSPHLPRPLHLALADPQGERDRRLFSHYLWNSSLLLAELIEAGTLGVDLPARQKPSGTDTGTSPLLRPADFDVAGLATLELGAGTALPSLLAALVGARRVAITDYPSAPVLATLHANVAVNVRPELSPRGCVPADGVMVEAHAWGDLSAPLAQGNAHMFDRVLAADCLWMPWEHDSLRRSIAWFLREGPDARAWVVAGFHTGRDAVRGFFGAEALAAEGLAVESIVERDCEGVERPWVWDRGVEEVGERRRWLVVAMLKRL